MSQAGRIFRPACLLLELKRKGLHRLVIRGLALTCGAWAAQARHQVKFAYAKRRGFERFVSCEKPLQFFWFIILQQRAQVKWG